MSELERLHATLLGLMATQRELMATDAPRHDRVSANRLALARASTARTRFLGEGIYPWLLARVDMATAREVVALRDAAAGDRVRSSSHVAKWSGLAILTHWPDYRTDAREILRMMAARIEAEQALLYPLLRDVERSIPSVAVGQ